MTAPTRPLRQRIKPLCRVCLCSSSRSLAEWPAPCLAALRQAEPAAPQRSGLADVRAGRMLTAAEAQQIASAPSFYRPVDWIKVRARWLTKAGKP